jgi:hypothetical protein
MLGKAVQRWRIGASRFDNNNDNDDDDKMMMTITTLTF